MKETFNIRGVELKDFEIALAYEWYRTQCIAENLLFNDIETNKEDALIAANRIMWLMDKIEDDREQIATKSYYEEKKKSA